VLALVHHLLHLQCHLAFNSTLCLAMLLIDDDGARCPWVVQCWHDCYHQPLGSLRHFMVNVARASFTQSHCLL
jgi:hypothetical protein